MSDNLPEVERALLAYQNSLDLRVGSAAFEMSQALEGFAKREIKGERGVVGRKVKFVDGQAKRGGKIYDYNNDRAVIGQPPKNRTGNLRRSIRGQSMRMGFAKYQAIVGADMVYARAVEFGSPYNPPSWRNNEHFPFLQPALNKFISSGKPLRILREYLGVK